jgi:hypothetical protein
LISSNCSWLPVRSPCGVKLRSKDYKICVKQIVTLFCGTSIHTPHYNLDLQEMAEILYTKLDLLGSWHTMPSIRYLVGALIMGLCVGAWRVRQYRYTCATVKTKPVLSDKKETVITPLEGFDWEKTEPLQFRPFKGKEKFNLTMCEYLFISYFFCIHCTIPRFQEHISINTY